MTNDKWNIKKELDRLTVEGVDDLFEKEKRDQK